VRGGADEHPQYEISDIYRIHIYFALAQQEQVTEGERLKAETEADMGAGCL